MKKIEQLEKMVNENGTSKMKEIVIVAKKYLVGLDNIFKERDVHKLVLETIDFPMFINELEEEGHLDNKSSMEKKLLLLNATQLTRHCWEFIDNNGNKKSGDDLHKAWPIIFPDEKMKDVDVLLKDLQYY